MVSLRKIFAGCLLARQIGVYKLLYYSQFASDSLANHYAQDRQAPTVTPFDGMTKTITPTNRHAKT